jgi:hypothetical protein
MASLYRMMNTEKPMRSVDAGALSPEEKAMYGIPADAKGSYILRQNAFTHEFTGAVPQSMGTANTYNAQGQAGVADKRAALNNGGALPAVGGGPSYNPTEIRLRPVGIDAATGRNKFMTPLELAASGRGLGGYSSSMIPSVRSSSVSQGTNGETNTSSTSHKVLPNILHVDASGKYPALDVPIPGAKSSEPSTASSINTPIKPFNPSDRIDNLVRLMGQDAANERLLYGRDKVAVTNRMAQLGIDPNNATGSMRDQAARAGLVLDHLKTINQIINKAEADGDLGLVASRWNDFLTNKLGKDPTKTQVFSKLSSQLGFLSTAIAMTHGGLRAGSSEPVIEHWQKVLYAQDPDTLRSKLAQATNWMQGYYGLVGSGKQAGGSKNDVTITPVTPSAQPVDSNKVNDFLKRHGIQ